MKRFISFLIVSTIIVVVAFGLFKLSNEYKMNSLKNNISWSVAYKNCKNAVAIEQDKDKNTYIVYANYIKVIKDDGREEILMQDNTLKIENILFYNNILYFISESNLYKYDLKNKSLQKVLENIPFMGKYMDRNIIIKNSKLLLSIGAATNSGIATYEDGQEVDKIPYDKSPIDIKLNGVNYGKNKTGAFMPYGNSSFDGQKIKGETLANACVVEVDLYNNKVALYSSGIRNVTGWDLDADGNLIGIVGGMENSEERPINRDFDYLYKIDKGKWYGWPDFSGGDPITSPRFKGEKTVEKLIQNHPNKIVPTPVYQFSDVGAMRYLAIDKEGKILDKNTKVYYDAKKNVIAALSKNYVLYDLLKLKDNSKIEGIKYINGDIYILDSGIGCVYKLQSENPNFQFNLPKVIWIFICVFLLIVACLIMYKFYARKRIK